MSNVVKTNVCLMMTFQILWNNLLYWTDTVCLFVCFFFGFFFGVFCLFGVYRPTRELFTHIHMETSILPVKGLQILTYARHSWPLSSESSLACHTYCDTGHPFIMVIYEDTHAFCRAFSNGDVTTSFYDLGLSQLGFEH